MGEKFKILVTCDLGSAALERLSAERGFEVVMDKINDPAKLAEAVGGVQGIIVRSNVDVTREVFERADVLGVVGRAGIGIDNIDLEAATEHGVAVVNAPAGNIATTAEHALALLMGLARKVPQANSSMKGGRWEKKLFMGRELRGKTLGVIGVGRVGSALVGMVEGLRMKVIGYDPFISAEKSAKLGIESVDLDRLLNEADVISLHSPLTPDTRNLLDKAAFAKVKPGVLLVNCARGGIIDEDALLAAIKEGRVAGAALDVFEVEPPSPHPLYERPEVVLTPHLGASTVEAQANVAAEVADNVAQYLEAGTAPNLLNAPKASKELVSRLVPFTGLASNLGAFVRQAADGPIDAVEVSCWGEAVSEGAEYLSASFLVGLLSGTLEKPVNIINAPSVARERGVKVVTSVSSEVRDFTELISIRVSGDWGEHEIEGTLFGKGDQRLVRFDDYRLDAVPEGKLVFIYNDDVPGVIGAVGNCLGKYGVNIAGMYNGRTGKGGKAITMVNVDETPGEEVISDLSSLSGILDVKLIILG